MSFFPTFRNGKGSHCQCGGALLRVTTKNGVSKKTSNLKGSEENKNEKETKSKPSDFPISG